MLPNPRTPVGKRQQQRNNNVTTTQQQIHRNRRIACGEPSDTDVTLVPPYLSQTSPQTFPGDLKKGPWPAEAPKWLQIKCFT